MKKGIVLSILIVLISLSTIYAEIKPIDKAQRLDYQSLSPFEFKDVLIAEAKRGCANIPNCTVLNAGRGNPNFLNTTVRDAFSIVHSYASKISARQSKIADIGFRPSKKGIYVDFKNYLKGIPKSKASKLLESSLEYAIKELKIDPDDLVHELVDASLGAHYPEPPRMLINSEKIVLAYLKKLHFLKMNVPQGDFDLFATEGATAAMIYLFQSLKQNFILSEGDKIAIITPIFSPYIEIPVLKEFALSPIYIEGSQEMGYHIKDSEIDKLKDKKIKVLFLVNPMNLSALAMSKDNTDRIAEIIKNERQDLIVVTDTVYVPFVDEFYDVVGKAPENTVLIYSYSKYYGVTGWRLGVVMLHRDNIIDKMIATLPDEKKKILHKHYGLITPEPEKIRFIDRMAMDSRKIALAHTGGLSTPQQSIMSLFSLFELVDKEDAYKKSIQEILKKRIKILYDQLGMKAPIGKDKTMYYTLLNILDIAKEKYGNDFATYLKERFSSIDYLLYLAIKKHTVLLPGEGFAAPPWTVRVSLANLHEKDYAEIGKDINKSLIDFYEQYKKDNKTR